MQGDPCAMHATTSRFSNRKPICGSISRAWRRKRTTRPCGAQRLFTGIWKHGRQHSANDRKTGKTFFSCLFALCNASLSTRHPPLYCMLTPAQRPNSIMAARHTFWLLFAVPYRKIFYQHLLLPVAFSWKYGGKNKKSGKRFAHIKKKQYLCSDFLWSITN